MIKLILLPLIFCLSIQVYAQTTSTNYAFEGLINTELKVRLRFTIENSKASGYCIYVDSKDKKEISGGITDSGILTLIQKNGERFEGKIIASYMYKGEYYNSENVDQGTFLFSKIEEPISEDEKLINNADTALVESSVHLDAGLSETEVNNILNTYLKEYKECYLKGIDPTKCQQYTARAITEVFKIDDFKDPYVGGSYLTMTESYDKIAADDQWKMLGEASEEGVLKQAIALANDGDLVVVAYAFKGFIQLSFLRKGEGHYSSKWGMKVPDVAIFFNNDSTKSSIDKTLSYLWRSPENLEIWIKK